MTHHDHAIKKAERALARALEDAGVPGATRDDWTREVRAAIQAWSAEIDGAGDDTTRAKAVEMAAEMSTLPLGAAIMKTKEQRRAEYERAAREAQEHDAEYSDVIESLEKAGVDPHRLRHWLAGPIRY
jgi:hypothetical protein